VFILLASVFDGFTTEIVDVVLAFSVVLVVVVLLLVLVVVAVGM